MLYLFYYSYDFFYASSACLLLWNPHGTRSLRSTSFADYPWDISPRKTKTHDSFYCDSFTFIFCVSIFYFTQNNHLISRCSTKLLEIPLRRNSRFSWSRYSFSISMEVSYDKNRIFSKKFRDLCRKFSKIREYYQVYFSLSCTGACL